jgi:hypothetical protein
MSDDRKQGAGASLEVNLKTLFFFAVSDGSGKKTQKGVYLMDANLLQEKENLFAVSAELEAESLILDATKKRGPSTQLRMNQKTKELSELDQVFAVTLRQIGRGEKEESELTSIRGQMDVLKVEIQNLQDLLDTLKRTEADSVAKVGKLADKVRGATHSFWFAISKHESEKINEPDAGPILRAYAAWTLSGLPENFGQFLLERFNNMELSDLRKIQDSLKKEYLETKPKKGGEK